MKSNIEICINRIAELRGKIVELNNDLDNVRNLREYDRIIADIQIARYDMRAASEELTRLMTIEIDCGDDIMSENAHSFVMGEFLNRAKKFNR